MSDTPQEAFTAIVSGRVQLVMYRDFAQRKARRCGVLGEVTNLPDGTVRVVAEGEKERLNRYITFLKKGSLLSQVRDVAISWEKPTGLFKGFSIRYHL